MSGTGTAGAIRYNSGALQYHNGTAWMNTVLTPCSVGFLSGGYCYFLGTVGATCSSVCSGASRTCDPMGTQYGNTNSATCSAILTGLGRTPGGSTSGAYTYGCAINASDAVRYHTTAANATCGASNGTFARACACYTAPDCLNSTGLAIGTQCADGAIYAGTFDGGSYQITPSGCTNSSTPTCAGGTDALTKTWRGSSGSDSDIAGVENVAAGTTASSSSYRGHVNTPAIVAHASVSSDSAADYCNDMVYAGYSDWYLPSKTELAYIYCHSNVSSHSSSYPGEYPDCVGLGGKTSELQGFIADWYWTSTENAAGLSWEHSFLNGGYGTAAKNSSIYVRCVRRY